ncbi:hypothetical protein L2E82_40584 [Cichorium intybus]|uniref:Uncharacterized protein n=3 Tax=Cichorium intybus TaxID=13427 RepID=A0ACB9AKM9_CICIN|nr:hypothetical protein L2E82_40582 [Cichorium intybus]KAI3710789.1 hypothetical protein L2E82_40583 [Cichorium intybus]KAI3710790.1 hypothetical protein L2E82_40584 [Cichorium intybus]
MDSLAKAFKFGDNSVTRSIDTHSDNVKVFSDFSGSASDKDRHVEIMECVRKLEERQAKMAAKQTQLETQMAEMADS